MRKRISQLVIIILCAVLLCPASPFIAKAGAAEKDPSPIRGYAYYVPEGCTSFQLNIEKKYPDLNLTYFTEDGETALTVDENGIVTLLTDRPGTYVVYAHNDETEQAQASTVHVSICIPLREQTLKGKTKVTGVFGKTIKLDIKAKTKVNYRSENKRVATVNANGRVTFRHPGKVTIVAVADNDAYYKTNCLVIKVTSKLGKPSLNVRAGHRMAKLSWSKVPKAQKYLVYCRYPGKKKYTLATAKPGSIRGTSHMNLKKGKKYSYKIRAYLELKGKKYYGPYSKTVTVKVK